jgi:8-oxo-dGTP pyrophosphatase MutT (NUDIX family)
LARARALAAGDAALDPDPDPSRARGVLQRYAPRDPQQADARARMLQFLDAHPRDAHRRELLVGHLTASALVVDARGERALLTHHRKLDRWLQLGGHCDGDANLAGTALRECLEESGIAGLAILPEPIDLDIHPIPARAAEPEHLHFDTRFLVLAPPGAVETASAESHALAWFTPRELERIETDDSVRRLFALVFA